MKVLIFYAFGLKMPVHAPKIGVLGVVYGEPLRAVYCTDVCWLHYIQLCTFFTYLYLL